MKISKDLQEKLGRYGKLKTTEKEIKSQTSDLKSVIEKEMEDIGLDEVESDYGTFQLREYSSYSYSDEYKKKKDELDKLKKQEQADGTAKKSVKSVLYFDVKKDNEDK